MRNIGDCILTYAKKIVDGCKNDYELWKTVNPRKSQEELYKALNPYYVE